MSNATALYTLYIIKTATFYKYIVIFTVKLVTVLRGTSQIIRFGFKGVPQARNLP